MLELWETTQFIENNILMWLGATSREKKKNKTLSTDTRWRWIMSKTCRCCNKVF